MSRRAPGKRWDTKFARFVDSYGVGLLAIRLSVNPSAVYHWLSGSTSPHPANAIRIQKLAKRRGIVLSLDQIYEHFSGVRSARYSASSTKPQPARESSRL